MTKRRQLGPMYQSIGASLLFKARELEIRANLLTTLFIEFSTLDHSKMISLRNAVVKNILTQQGRS